MQHTSLLHRAGRTALGLAALASFGTAPLQAASPVQPLPQIDARRPATPAQSPGRTQCNNITGFLTDADPAGRIIRAGPSRTAREIGRIPPPVATPDYAAWPYQFEIIGSQNGWLEITDIQFDTTRGATPPPRVFPARGWIAAGAVRLGAVQSRLAFARPTHSAPVLIDTRPNDLSFDELGMRRIIACSDNWVLADWNATTSADGPNPQRSVTYRREAVVARSPVVLRGWTTGICNIIETTCDGVDGDRPTR